ncbi:MAG: glycoside hydrolase family 3 N-terminal domain-containing protein [candidate division Zixibacteria bacterium]|jgi:beta-N-acetylhexosaminidase|nr:glycoside hydrolase family 3 N-terminal domain-containing protein [candidate division Zixibacteria bacterium]
MLATAPENIGRLFIVGYRGERVPDSFVKLARQRRLGGVILFEDNCRSSQGLSKSIAAIKRQYTDSPPFIAIDQEGGRVCRLRGAPAEFKAPAEYGRYKANDSYAEDYGRAMVYLESLGINLNLAPVCDLFLNDANSCLKGRSFGATPDEVIPFVRSSIHLARRNGVLSCAKHFPGFGAAAADPHVVTSSADFDLRTWSGRESKVFEAAIAAGVDMVMTTHMHVPEFDNVIATGSHRMIDQLLRVTLNFEGPVITDDLCMQGAAVLGDLGNRTVAAFMAGHDLLLFGQDTDRAVEAMDAFAEAVRRGDIPKDRLRRSLERIASVKCTLGNKVIL